MCLWWESKPEEAPAKDCVMCKLIENIRADERKECAVKIERAHQRLDFLDLSHYHWCDYSNAHDALKLAVDLIKRPPLSAASDDSQRSSVFFSNQRLP